MKRDNSRRVAGAALAIGGNAGDGSVGEAAVLPFVGGDASVRSMRHDR